MIGKLWALALFGAVLGPAVSASAEDDVAPPPLQLVISVAEQKLAVVKDGGLVRKYPVSTSKFGLGDSFNSYRTPLGRLRVCDKIGDDLPLGSVLKCRNATGEILPANSPGRDPIVTRILWLDGLESGNVNARSRGIYIHGTVEESKLGQPVSYGCIRMKSRDVVEVFDSTPVGTPVEIIADRFPAFRKFTPPKTETLFAANDGITTTIGPRGMVVVRTTRPGTAATTKPAATPEPIRPATTKLTPKAPEAPAKAPEVPAKSIAKAAPTPEPVAEGPTVLLTTFRSAGKAPVAPAQKPAAPDEPRVILMSGSMLTADLDRIPKSAPAPAAPAEIPPPAPQRAIEPPAPAAPRLIALDLTAISFVLLEEDAAPAPIDALTRHLLNPPEPQLRLAFRARPPQHGL